ncbi:hypothetical protein CDIK_2223 [Cucumispora dikerogammari]|nr:hypothetical protein CDIK_2223 [Cucumispora dikerogammari]
MIFFPFYLFKIYICKVVIINDLLKNEDYKAEKPVFRADIYNANNTKTKYKADKTDVVNKNENKNEEIENIFNEYKKDGLSKEDILDVLWDIKAEETDNNNLFNNSKNINEINSDSSKNSIRNKWLPEKNPPLNNLLNELRGDSTSRDFGFNNIASEKHKNILNAKKTEGDKRRYNRKRDYNMPYSDYSSSDKYIKHKDNINHPKYETDSYGYPKPNNQMPSTGEKYYPIEPKTNKDRVLVPIGYRDYPARQDDDNNYLERQGVDNSYPVRSGKAYEYPQLYRNNNTPRNIINKLVENNYPNTKTESLLTDIRNKIFNKPNISYRPYNSVEPNEELNNYATPSPNNLETASYHRNIIPQNKHLKKHKPRKNKHKNRPTHSADNTTLNTESSSSSNNSKDSSSSSSSDNPVNSKPKTNPTKKKINEKINDKLKKIELKLNTAQTNFNATKHKLSSLNTSLETEERLKKKNTDLLNNLKENISNTSNEEKQKEASLRLLANELSEKQKIANNLQYELTKEQKKVELLKDFLKQYNESVGGIKNNIERSDNLIKNINNEKENVENQMCKHKGVIDSLMKEKNNGLRKLEEVLFKMGT